MKAVLDALDLNYNIDKPQTLEQYNADLEEGDAEIEKGNFISANQFKAEISKIPLHY